MCACRGVFQGRHLYFRKTNRGAIVRTDTYPKPFCHISLVSWDDWKDFRFGDMVYYSLADIFLFGLFSIWDQVIVLPTFLGSGHCTSNLLGIRSLYFQPSCSPVLCFFFSLSSVSFVSFCTFLHLRFGLLIFHVLITTSFFLHVLTIPVWPI